MGLSLQQITPGFVSGGIAAAVNSAGRLAADAAGGVARRAPCLRGEVECKPAIEGVAA